MMKRTLSALAAVAVLSACVAGPRFAPVRRPVEPVTPPVNLSKVYFYPQQGQSEEQQDRDRYDCHYWAVRQSGFDPSLHLEADTERAAVVPARSADQTIGTAAVVGAMIGAVAAGRGEHAEGAVIGAIAGSALGAAAASADDAEARRITQRRNAQGFSRYEKEAAEFRRAMSACLEGRGYSVK